MPSIEIAKIYRLTRDIHIRPIVFPSSMATPVHWSGQQHYHVHLLDSADELTRKVLLDKLCDYHELTELLHYINLFKTEEMP